MNRGWIVFVYAAAAIAWGGCSPSPAGGDVFDVVSIDTSEEIIPGDVADAATDSAQDVSEDGGLPADTVDDSTPDIVDSDTSVPAPIEKTGFFRYDWVKTETGLLERFLTLDDGDRRTVAVSRCGEMAAVFADRYEDDGFKASLVFSKFSVDSPPDIDDLVPRHTLLTRSDTTTPPPMRATVAFDDCTPIVFVQTETGWDFTVVGEGEVTWTPVDPSRQWTDVISFGAQVGRDHKVHLVFRGKPGGSTTQWADAVRSGTGFSVSLFANPDAGMAAPIDVAINGDGFPVIGYRKAGLESSEAWIAAWDGAAWKKEQIPGVTPSDLGASFAIGSYGREGLAWAAVVESDDGILLSSALKYTFRDTDNSFRTETVTVENDGYAGSGNRFTGGRPILTIDGTGRPHILYSDIAIGMNGGTQTVSHGQLRYAWRRVNKWNQLTVFSQESPGTDAQAYTGFREVAVSPDGTTAGVAGVAIVPDRFGDVPIDTLGWILRNAD